ncbi:MAG: NYN domain-containing protein [Sporolactobacillus sp.]
MDDILIVDGYNVIGAWHQLSSLRRKDFENARDTLIDKLSEYQAQTGWRIILIFDAYLKPGKETTTRKANIDIIYTKKSEKADQKIEGLIRKLKNVKTRVYVATSDMAEQWVVFSQGALRIPSRELVDQLEKMDRHLEEKTSEDKPFKGSKIPMDEATRKRLEQIRRGF